MKGLKETLMEMEGITAGEAEDRIQEAKEVLQEYLDEGDQSSAYDVCKEMFGLEPDYLEELMF